METCRRVSVCDHRLGYGLIGRNTFGGWHSACQKERGTGAEHKDETQAREREVCYNLFKQFGSAYSLPRGRFSQM
jgi:hypothetical protein